MHHITHFTRAPCPLAPPFTIPSPLHFHPLRERPLAWHFTKPQKSQQLTSHGCRRLVNDFAQLSEILTNQPTETRHRKNDGEMMMSVVLLLCLLRSLSLSLSLSLSFHSLAWLVCLFLCAVQNHREPPTRFLFHSTTKGEIESV